MNRRLLVEAIVGITLLDKLSDAGSAMPQDQVIELRQYTLRGGQRDVLISMFEKYFLAALNAVQAHIVGTFRDLDDPDRFVWIRSFRDMAARPQALAAFYDSPLWQSMKADANATIVDSNNVLLLRPLLPEYAIAFPAQTPTVGGAELIGATIFYLGSVSAVMFGEFFEKALLPRVTALGGKPIARLVTEEIPNNYPRLPVREGERVFIWFARWPTKTAEAEFTSRFNTLSGWRDSVPEAVLPALMRKPERLRLTPTSASELR